MCMDAYICFVIIMVFFFLLGALGTPRANYIMVWHFPKKWGNATMPRSGIGPGYHSNCWER